MASLWNVIVLFWIVVLGGCTQLGPYRVDPDFPRGADGRLPVQPVFDPEKSRECDGSCRCIQFVEYDEFGNIFSRAQLAASLSAAKDVSQRGGTVIVYVHGWHHSAKPGDSNIESFQSLVSAASEKNEEVLGIYIGWRGDSLNSENIILRLPGMMTFWNRKATAHAVGHGGGVSELIRKLSDIRAIHKDSRLMILGHSFGGAIAYSALSQALAEQIRLDAISDEYSYKELLFGSSDRADGQHHWVAVADLVVLINPAFEAMRMAPLYELAGSADYPDDLAPRLVVITTIADGATRMAFPVGRFVSTFFQAHPSAQARRMDKVAIGHYIPYVTHQLIEGQCDKNILKAPSALQALVEPSGGCFSGSGGGSSVVLTRCNRKGDCARVAGDHYIARGAADAGYIHARFPISLIRTDAGVMGRHNDIWNSTMSGFLFELLTAVIESPTKI